MKVGVTGTLPAMNERQRMQYMEAAGIDMFVPRFALSQARPSVTCALPDEPIDASPSPPAQGAPALRAIDARNDRNDSSKGPSIVALGDILQTSEVASAIVQSGVDINDNPSSSAIEPAVEPILDPDAQFSLSIWRVSDSLLAVDARQVGAALPTEALLSNILRACAQGSGYLPASDTLSWPMVDLPGKPKDWAAAREMVATFLEGKLLVKPVTTMLLFGEESFRAIADEALSADACRNLRFECVDIDAFAAQALVFPSIAEILHDPSQKKTVWQCLLRHGIAQR